MISYGQQPLDGCRFATVLISHTMKPLPIAISLAAFLLSCGQPKPGTFDYQKLNYDSDRITIFKWDTAKLVFPNNSEPIRLTQEDLAFCDSMLQEAIDSFNRYISPGLYEAFNRSRAIDSFIIKKEKYRYQYFPFEDVNGHHRLNIVGFSNNFQRWKTDIYEPRIHCGMNMVQIDIFLTERDRSSVRSAYF